MSPVTFRNTNIVIVLVDDKIGIMKYFVFWPSSDLDLDPYIRTSPSQKLYMSKRYMCAKYLFWNLCENGFDKE